MTDKIITTKKTKTGSMAHVKVDLNGDRYVEIVTKKGTFKFPYIKLREDFDSNKNTPNSPAGS